MSEEYAEVLASTGYKVKCQFAIDTGMNRIGLDADVPGECIRIIRKYSQILNVEGNLLTSICVADALIRPAIDSHDQVSKFKTVADGVLDLGHLMFIVVILLEDLDT